MNINMRAEKCSSQFRYGSYATESSFPVSNFYKQYITSRLTLADAGYILWPLQIILQFPIHTS